MSEAPLLVGLVGYAQVGKDTAAAWLHDTLGYEHRAFAGPLRLLAERINPILNGEPMTYRQALRIHGYEAAKLEVPGFREFLKDLGNGARDVVGEDVWINAAFRKMPRHTVFSDVRFLNEADAIRRRARTRGGEALLLRIVRPGHGPESDFEAEVPRIPVDYIVDNSGSLEHFRGGLAGMWEHRTRGGSWSQLAMAL